MGLRVRASVSNHENTRVVHTLWSAELAGVRVAVLADLHVGSPFNGIAKLETIVQLTNSLKPDLIVIPGDLVIHGVRGGTFVAPEEAAAVLARLTAPMGVWASLGNHDWWLDGRRVLAALEKQKIGALEDSAVRIERGSTHFLAGWDQRCLGRSA